MKHKYFVRYNSARVVLHVIVYRDSCTRIVKAGNALSPSTTIITIKAEKGNKSWTKHFLTHGDPYTTFWKLFIWPKEKKLLLALLSTQYQSDESHTRPFSYMCLICRRIRSPIFQLPHVISGLVCRCYAKVTEIAKVLLTASGINHLMPTYFAWNQWRSSQQITVLLFERNHPC